MNGWIDVYMCVQLTVCLFLCLYVRVSVIALIIKLEARAMVFGCGGAQAPFDQ